MFPDGYPYLLTTEVSHLVQSFMGPASHLSQESGLMLSLQRFVKVPCHRNGKTWNPDLEKAVPMFIGFLICIHSERRRYLGSCVVTVFDEVDALHLARQITGITGCSHR